MAAQVGIILIYNTLVKFDSPDGSTCCGLKYYILVNFDHPDGSTSSGHINHDSLV